MPAYVTREEFKVLESEVEDEKLVTRYILEQTKLNSADLATLIRKVDGRETRVESLEIKVGAIDAKLTGLIHNLPAMIAAAMRGVLGERRKKSSKKTGQ